MLFFRIEGLNANEKWADENEDRRVLRERTRKIAACSERFNMNNKRRVFFYVAEASDDTVSIGAICRGSEDVNKLALSYLKAIGIDLMDIVIEEITLDSTKNMLSCACRNDYIRDDDVILEDFELDMLGRHCGIDYGENIICESDKEELYREASRYLASESFIPELDRIFAGKKPCKAEGHPVHYMIQTDDRETRKGMYRLLLGALYSNGRLCSKRYCFLDFRPGNDFSTTVYDHLYKSSIGGAVIVRYLANDDSESEHANSGRDLIEKLCEVMKKYRNRVLTVFCLPRECTVSKEIFYENLGNIGFVEIKEEFVYGNRAKSFLSMLARENGVRADKKLFAKLEENKGYLTPDLNGMFDEWYNNKLKTDVYPQYKEIASVKHELVKSRPKGSAYDELNNMIGIAEAKKVIKLSLDYFKAQKLFADKGMTADRPAMHMVFTGNPGTAKTTVARLFAEIMKDNGLLSKGDLIEVGRGDLVGKYVGWTAPTIQKKFKEAKGSVLFIDEAYSLVDDRDGLYGDEAINTIVQEMENHRDEVIVIFAGYPDKMEGFLNKNPGLRSRIAFHVPFADYNTEELCGIAKLIAEKKGLKLTDGAYEKLAGVFDTVREEKDFGNGRYVRNVIEKAKMAHACRILTLDIDTIRKDDVITICADDIDMPQIRSKKANNRVGFCVA